MYNLNLKMFSNFLKAQRSKKVGPQSKEPNLRKVWVDTEEYQV